MNTDKPIHFKLFLICAAILSACASLWLVLTPSKSTDLVLFSYSIERIILIATSLLLTLTFSIGILFVKKPFIKNTYFWITRSKLVFFIVFILGLFLAILFIGTLLGRFEPWNFIFRRIHPIIVLGFMLTVEVILFQQIDGDRLPVRILNSLLFPDYDQNEYIKSNGRDLRLDFLRGFFIIVMIIDHIAGKSPLYYITFGDSFFTSAAEGFFLISGIVAGLVYAKVIQRNGLWSAIKKSWFRAVTIYLVTISLSLSVLIAGSNIQPSLINDIQPGTTIQMLFGLLLLKSSYYLSHVLVIYALLFLIFPVILLLLRFGKTWLLFLLTIGYYIISQVFPTIHWFPIYTFMEFPGVLLLFSLGVAIGYLHILENLQQKIYKRWLWLFGMCVFLLIMLWNLDNPGISNLHVQIPSSLTDKISLFFDKPSVAPGRFLASFITFGFLYLAITFSWRRINRLFGWLILSFGQNSLVAFAIHVILCMVYIIFSAIVTYNSDSFWLNGLFQLIGVLLTWGLVNSRLFASTASKKKFFYAIPPLLIITYLILTVAV